MTPHDLLEFTACYFVARTAYGTLKRVALAWLLRLSKAGAK